MKYTVKLKRFSVLLLLIMLAAFSFTGCASKSAKYDRTMKAEMRAPSPKMMMERKPSFSRKKADTIRNKPESDNSTRTSRMIYYNGYLQIRVVKPTDSIKKATDIVKSYGGYVEYLRDRSVSFRVPVKKFKKVFNILKKLGDVLNKSISAEDITDAYSNMELRLRVAEETRKRFLELLKRVKDEKEKIRLIKEIQRLNEKIEKIRDNLTLLSSLASFSKITVNFVPRQNMMSRGNRNDHAGFRWIYRLSPFTKSVASMGKAVELNVPEGMVKLASERYWIAESANGVTLLSYRLRNNPKGNTSFWVSAVKRRLKGEFSSAKIISKGNYKLLRLTSITEKPYIYTIGFRVVENFIHMVEIYFPQKKLEKRYLKSITNSIIEVKADIIKEETK